ncbi:MAG: cold shock domain-containing protein [Sulfurovaceae bacterium]|nr:cold shock domain-containing protein [Sulfurovaceae bacterium]
MRGEITQWKDDKGFGFITQDNNTESIFFHISSVKEQSNRPKIGDTVTFQTVRDSRSRLKAKMVVIEGHIARNKQKNKRHIHTEPATKDVLDYILIIIFVISLAVSVYIYFQVENIESTIPYGIPAIFSVLLLNRQKKPKNNNYSCIRCKKISKHSKRTISAWNRGFVKLYCSSCHHKWVIRKSTNNTYKSSSNSGCLGVLVLVVVIPIVTGIQVYNWFS